MYRFGNLAAAPGNSALMQDFLGYGYGPERITSPMPDQKALLTSRFAADPPKAKDTGSSTEDTILQVLTGLLGIGAPLAKLLMKSGALDDVIGDLFGNGSGTVPGDFMSSMTGGADVLNGGVDVGADMLGSVAGGPAAAGAGALDVGIGPGSAAFEAASTGAADLAPSLGLDLGGEIITGGAADTALEGGIASDLLGLGGGEGGFSILNPGPGGLFGGQLSATAGGVGGALGGALSAGLYAAPALAAFLGMKEIAPPNRTFNSYGGGYSQDFGDLSAGADPRVAQFYQDVMGDRSWLPEGADLSKIGRLDFDIGTFGKTGQPGNGSDYFSIGGVPVKDRDAAIQMGRDIALKRMGLKEATPMGIDFANPNAVHNFWADRKSLPIIAPKTPIDSVSWGAAQDRFQNMGMGEGQNMVTPMENDAFYLGLDPEMREAFRLGWNPYNAYAYGGA